MSFGGKLLWKCFMWNSFGSVTADAAVRILLDVVSCMDATPSVPCAHTVHLLLSATIFPLCTHKHTSIQHARVNDCETHWGRERLNPYTCTTYTYVYKQSVSENRQMRVSSEEGLSLVTKIFMMMSNICECVYVRVVYVWVVVDTQKNIEKMCYVHLYLERNTVTLV